MSRQTWPLVAFSVLCIAAAALIPAVPQPLVYHDFADQRTLFGVHNFMDVASNAAFVAAGVAGLIVSLGRRGRFERSAERIPYAAFFAGVALTGAGSAYYHLAPGNETLFWDRLPMTIAFMSLVSAQVADRISARVGLALLGPLLALGAWTVLYWIQTERVGTGDLVPYAVLQGYSVVMLLGMAALYPPRYTRGDAIYWVFAAYLLAKLFEVFDRAIFAALGSLVSGHTLKHLAAAGAAAIVAGMVTRRVPLR